MIINSSELRRNVRISLQLKHSYFNHHFSVVFFFFFVSRFFFLFGVLLRQLRTSNIICGWLCVGVRVM